MTDTILFVRWQDMGRLILFALTAAWISNAIPCERQARINERPLHYAWWLRIHFAACDSELYGIPVQSLHPTWQRASLLREEYIPKSALYETGRNALEEAKLQFEVVGDFNGDQRTDRAVVGVYDTPTESGRFVLIVTEQSPGVWRRAFLQLYPGDPGFLGLRKLNSKLEVWSCMECSGVSDLAWNPKTKRYAWLKARKHD